ncbi:endonuclease VIII [Anaerovorax odorimutans]|uniref:Formamidopyrimidine-DNA glycosylase n=1 Tax=Anaerovorax odorimutans TaxID=109327 RepID=A0ABT1RN21_9FIRM|nr:zinc finger domain-containing protein [Anaerovorax odorimutans]MCQ4636588.1 endonuclease VIII [Anaerovorax odorimutans]
MIEIPESHTLARQLNETVKGKTIETVLAGKSPHKFAFFTGEPECYPPLLEGKRVDGAEALSGWIQLRIGELRLTFNDGTNLRFFEAGEKVSEKHQLYMEFKDGTVLTCSIQMYGGIHLFRERENDNIYYMSAKSAPSPLTEAFDFDHFASLWDAAKETLSAKGLLATEQRIPGLGNGVLQDILFRAGVNPKSKLKDLEDKRRAIFESIRETLAEMTEKGGRDTEKDLRGNPGGYRTILSSKTWKGPCPVCGGVIERKAYLGGNVYYCPNCQPLK